MKRILSMLIAVIMVLSMIPPLDVFAADPVTVYMDPANGNNENAGTEAAPVKDFAGAYALLQAGGGKIVLLSDATYSSVLTLPACDYPVTITSKTGAEGISINNSIVLSGETTFEHMTLTHLKASSARTIRANGYKLTMGEGLTTVPYTSSSDSLYFCLEGALSSGGPVESTELTVKSGQYRYIYVGGYSTAVTGNAKLTMTGGKASWVAACRTGSISGNVEMTFSGTANITSVVYGGAATSGNISGNSTITLGQGAKIANLYVGSNGAGNITGTATVIIDGYDGTFTTLAGTGGTSCTGSIGATRLLLKSGTLSKTPTDFDTVDIDISEGKTLSLACSLSADTLKSSGTLNFSGAASLTAAAVTGSVACTVEGEVLKNQPYITAPADANITFPAESGVTEHNGKWVNQDLVNFEGLVVKSDSANTIKLYTGIWNRGSDSNYTFIEPYHTETVEGITYRYYSNLQGSYHVRATRSGYISLYKDIYMSPEEAATRTVQTITIEKKGEGGFVPSVMYSHTDEVLANPEAWKSDISSYPKYKDALVNPILQEDRDPMQQTTNEELGDMLTAALDYGEDMYLFSLGKSDEFGYDIPAVVFTRSDLSGAEDLEEAIALMDDSRLNVLYRAQIHGNEPAGGEGALAMIYYLQQGYKENILDKMNLIIIPRLSPDGSYWYQRKLYNSDHTCDHLLLETGEVRALQKAYLQYKPEVIFDGHERNWNNQGGDIQVSTFFNTANSDAWRTTALALDEAAFTELEANSLCGSYYSGAVNGYNPNYANGYFVTAGSMYVLMESRGIYGGNEAIERRIVAQMAAVNGLLDYLSENAATVKAMVTAERATIVSNGKTYEEDDLLVLQTDSRTTTDADKEAWGNLKTDRQTINWSTGEVTYPTRYPNVYDVQTRTRVAPTAYVVPADADNIENILTQIEIHGITYSYLPAGATLQLQHYSGDTTEATLSEEALTRFANGCYVFTMNQEKGLVLAALMEPDNTNASEQQGTLAQRGLLSVSDTYRYIRDLNAQGTVDHTITDAEFVNITVWLDGTNGADTNDGLSEATAVKTLEKAYAIMEAALADASADSQANLKIVGLYELGTARVDLPSANFHVTISGKTTADGFSFTGGGSQSTRVVDINGPTTFQNMTLHVNNTGSYNHLNCNGHKVVFGEGMNCTANKANCYFTLAGGAYGGDAIASTDLTVRSGKWNTIYVGGYTTKVTGQAKADISGCWVYHQIDLSYRGSADSMDLKVANTTVSIMNENSGIYAGITDDRDVDITGDVTITLGENVVAQAVYASSRVKGDIHGTVTIIADGVDFSEAPIYAKARASTGTTAAAVLKLNADVTQDVTLDAALPVDLNGKNLTGTITGEGTLLIFDSANDTYDAAKCGTVAAGTNVQTVVDAPNGNRYVAVTEDNKISFHRLNVEITAVSLRTATGGLYYWADWDCDSTLAGNIKNYGIACKLNSAPDAAALQDELAGVTNGAVLYSQLENSAAGDEIFADANANDEITGAIMDGIISDEVIEGYTNAQRGQLPIYAEPYVILDSGEVVVAEGGVNYSLYSVCQAIDEMITGMEDAVTKADYIAYMESLFADVWNKYSLGWSFTNFSKAT